VRGCYTLQSAVESVLWGRFSLVLATIPPTDSAQVCRLVQHFNTSMHTLTQK